MMTSSAVFAAFLGIISIYGLSANATGVCRQRPADFIFLIDGSRSVRPSNFELVKAYIKNFANDLNDFVANNLQLGVVQFSTEVREEIRLGQYRNSNELGPAVDAIQYMEMGTMTGEALEFVVDEVLQPSHGSRLNEGVHTVLIVLTDGKSQDHARGGFTRYERLAKRKGVEIFAIGIGRRSNLTELRQLASKPKRQHVYQVQRFDDIPQLKIIIPGQTICEKNKCELITHNCTQLCIDTAESFKCACRDGFVLQADGKTCLPGEAPTLGAIWFTNITHTSARVHWNTSRPISNKIVYILGFAKSGGKKRIVRIPGNTTTLLQDLDPSTDYAVNLVFMTPQQLSLPIEGSLRTLRLGRTQLTLTNRTMTTFIIRWTPATGDRVTGYGIQYYPRSQPPASSEEFNTILYGENNLQYTVTSLQPDIIYIVKVTPIHARNLRGRTSTDRIKTLPYPIPFVAVTNPTLSTLSARWKLKYKYRVLYWYLSVHDDQYSFNKSYRFDADVQSTVFKKLNPNTNYTVEVRALISEGYQPNVQEIRTAKGSAFKKTKMILKPRVTVGDVREMSFVVRWEELNFVADSWIVKVFPKGHKDRSKQQRTGRGELEAIFTDLPPSTRYKVEVTGRVERENRTFKSPRGKAKATTRDMTSPSVTITDIDSSSFQINWNPINVDVDQWLVRIYRSGQTSFLREVNVIGSKRRFLLSGLQPNTEYSVKISGFITREGIRRDGPQGTASASTKREIVTPSVTIENVTPISLTARWGEVNFPVNSWRVVIKRADTPTSENDQENPALYQIFNFEGNRRTSDIRSLSPDTDYIIEVTASNGEVTSGVGRSRSRTTSLTAPRVEIIETTTSTLTTRWERINVPVTSWRVMYRQIDSEATTNVDVQGNDRETVLTNLDPDTTYVVAVLGVIRQQTATYESPSGETSGTTSYISIPAVTIEDATPFTLRARWGRVNFVVASWYVTIRKADSVTAEGVENAQDYEQEVSLDSSLMSKNFELLSPDTEYIIEVTAVGGGSTRRTGQTKSRTESLTSPTVQVINRTTSTLSIRWNDINVPVDNWIITYTNNDYEEISETVNMSGDDHETILRDLIPSTVYNIAVVGSVSSSDRTYRSPDGETSGTTDNLSTPLVTTDDITPFSMRVNWNDINYHQVDYWIVLIKFVNQDLQNQGTVDANTHEKVFSNLSPGTEFIVEVTGYVGKKTSGTGSKRSTTESLTSPTVQVTDTTTSTLSIRWNNINVPVDNWIIAYTNDDDETTQTIKMSGDEHETVLRDLIPSTVYDIEVVGTITSSGQRYESPDGETSGTTDNLSTPLVTTDDITPFSMRVNWNDINYHQVDYWIVLIKFVNQDLQNQGTVDANTHEKVFSNLSPGTEFIVEVTGYVGEIRSGTGSKRSRTESLTSPTVQVIDRTTSTLSIRWNDINVPVDNWIITYTNDDDETSQTVNVSGDEYETVLRDLKPSTAYTVRVLGSVTPLHDTYESSVGQTSGTTDNLSTPSVTINNVTPFSMQANWNDNYPVDSWNVIIRRTGGDNSDDNSDLILQEILVDPNTNERVFSNLTPETEYVVEVTGQVGELRSGTGSQRSTTEPLTSPTVQVTDTTTSTLSIRWNDINVPVDNWIITYTNDDDETSQTINISGDEYETVLRDLDPSTVYDIEVVGSVTSSNRAYQSPPGQTSGTTNDVSTPTVSIDNITPLSMRINWNGINYPVDTWMIVVRQTNRDVSEEDESLEEIQEVTVVGDQRNKIFTNLSPGTEYSIEVTGHVGEIRSGPGSQQATTGSLTRPSVQVTDTTTSTLSLRWNDINVPVDNWIITYTNDDDETSQTINMSEDEHETLLRDLNPSTAYNIEVVGSVRSVNRTYQSPAGQTIGNTDDLSTPTVTIDNITPFSMRVNWNDINYAVDNWMIVVRQTNQEASDDDDESTTAVIQQIKVGGNDHNKVFTNLIPGTEYVIEVTGHDGDVKSGTGSQQSTTELLTSPIVEVTDTTTSSLSIRWNDINVPVDNWIITYTNDNDEETSQTINMSGDDHETVLRNLKPSIVYDIEVVGSVTTSDQTYQSPPGQISINTDNLSTPSVTIDNLTPFSMRVNWNEINYLPVDIWNVVIKKVEESAPTDEEVNSIVEEGNVSGNEYSKTVSDLSPGSEYIVEITGYVGRIRSGTGSQQVATDELSATSVEVIETTYSTMSVRWNKTDVNINNWIVKVTTDDDQVVEIANVTGIQTEKTFTGLNEGTEYNVEVTGFVVVNGNVYETPIAETSDSTESLISISGPMVECIASNLTSLRATWSDVTSDVTSWSVKIYLGGGKNMIQRQMLPRDRREFVFSKLWPATSYIVQVTGNVLEGELLFKTQPGTVNCTTETFLAPNVQINHNLTTFSSMAINWDSLRIPVTKWIVQLRNGESVQIIEAGKSERSFIFGGLTPETQYTASVSGVLIAGRREIKSPAGQDSGLTGYFLSPYLECGYSTPESLRVDWYLTDAFFPADQWVLELSETGSNEKTKVSVAARALDSYHSFTGLSPDRSYSISIHGKITLYNRTYLADPEVVECHTEKLSAPEVTSYAITPVSFTVDWSNIDIPVDSWSVSLKTPASEFVEKPAYSSYSPETMYPNFFPSGSSEDEGLVLETIVFNSSIHNHTFETLTPETSYSVEVFGIKSGEQGEVGVTRTSTLPLPKPKIFISSATPTSLQANWAELEIPVDSWLLRIYSMEDYEYIENNEANPLQERIVNGTTLSINFQGLNPDSLYRIQLSGILRNYTSPTHSLLHPTLPLTAPQVTVLYTTINTLTVEWSPINAEVDRWEIHLLNEENVEFQSYVTDGWEKEAIFGGLAPDSTYTVRVVGIVQLSDGNRVESPVGENVGDTDGFEAPIVRIGRVTPTTLEGAWGVINTPVDSWRVRIITTQAPIDVVMEVVLSKNVFYKVFTGLTPGTPYRVEVEGDIGRYISQTGQAAGTTESLTAPKVYITSTTPTTVEARWNNFNLPEDYWTVTIREAPSSEDESTEPIPPLQELRVDGDDPQNVVFSNLSPGTAYVVEVVGHAGELYSPSGEARSITSALQSPEVSLSSTSASSLTATWNDINVEVYRWNAILLDEYGNVVNSETTESNQRQVTFNNLFPDTTYKVRVVGVIELNDETRYESPAGEDSATTESLTAPDVFITSTTPTTVEARWNNFNLPEDYWTVTIREAPSSEDESTEPIPPLQEIKLEGSRPQNWVFGNLSPSTSYVVQVVGHSGGFTSPRGEAEGTTESVMRPALEVTNSSLTSFTLSWTDINVDVDSWKIQVNNLPFTKTQFVDGTKRLEIITGLKPNTRYYVTVEGYKNKQSLSSSPIVLANTMSLNPPEVSASEMDPTSVQVIWSGINVSVDSWIVKLKKPDVVEESTVPAGVKTAIFSGLVPSSSYSIEVAGVVQNITSPFGQARFTTDSLSTPTVHINVLTPSTARVDWSDINVPVDEWRVLFRQVPSEQQNPNQTTFQKELILNGDTQSVSFDSLYPNTEYEAEVIGTVMESRSPPGQARNVTSSLSAPVINITDVGLSTITVRWNDINNPVSSWLVVVTDVASGVMKNYEIPFSTREVTVEELEPDTRYEIDVIGVIEISDGVTVQSLPGSDFETTNSLTPPTVHINVQTPTTARVEWSDVSVPVDKWTVVFQKVIMDEQNENQTVLRKEINLESDARSVGFDCLLPGSEYKAEVVGTVRGYDSPPGRARNTTSSLTTPAVDISNATFTSMNVRWSDINNEVSLWSIEISNDRMGQIMRYEIDPSQRQFTLEDLKPSAQYSVSVAGLIEMCNGFIVQSPAGSKQQSTVYLNGPHVDCVETTSTSVTVEWMGDPTLDVVSWTVRMFPANSEGEEVTVEQDSSTNRYTFVDLRPSTKYFVEVKGRVREGDHGFDTPPMQDSCTTRPASPSNLEVTERGITRLQAHFSPSSSAVLGYEGYCQAVLSNETRRAVIASDFVVECFNLQPASQYNIVVQALFRNLTSKPVSIKNVTLTPSPFGLTLLDPSTHTILAEWQAPGIKVDQYEVTYYLMENDTEVQVVDGNQNTLLLTDLEPNTTYFVEVKAVINGIKSASDKTSDTTLQESLPLQVEDVSFTSINVTWSRSRVPHARFYVLEYFPMMSRDESRQAILPINVTNYLIRNLKTATDYVVTITVKYRRTMSPVTQRHVTTLALSPRGPITFTNNTDSSFVAHWLPPLGEPKPSSYVIMYYDHRMLPTTIDGVTDTEYIFDDLTPSTAYNVTVMALYPNELESHAIRGTTTTLETQQDCSCSTYVRTQSQMQALLHQMMEKIDALTEKVEELTTTRRRFRKRRRPQN